MTAAVPSNRGGDHRTPCPSLEIPPYLPPLPRILKDSGSGDVYQQLLRDLPVWVKNCLFDRSPKVRFGERYSEPPKLIFVLAPDTAVEPSLRLPRLDMYVFRGKRGAVSSPPCLTMPPIPAASG